MSEVFPLIPAPTPSVVPCSISCGSYAVITHRHVILGHYQLSTNIRKACPCFDAEKEYAELY